MLWQRLPELVMMQGWLQVMQELPCCYGPFSPASHRVQKGSRGGNLDHKTLKDCIDKSLPTLLAQWVRVGGCRLTGHFPSRNNTWHGKLRLPQAVETQVHGLAASSMDIQEQLLDYRTPDVLKGRPKTHLSFFIRMQSNKVIFCLARQTEKKIEESKWKHQWRDSSMQGRKNSNPNSPAFSQNCMATVQSFPQTTHF